MIRLDYDNNLWTADENVPMKSMNRMVIPNFKEEEEECWHLRGRGWHWTILRCHYPKLVRGTEYELYFWAKIDYYSGNGTRCYIDLCEVDRWEQRIVYEINPYSPNAIATCNDWVLYRFEITGVSENQLLAQVVAFEANIAIMKAAPGDETEEGVTQITPGSNNDGYYVNCEIPFKEYDSLEQRVVQYYIDLQGPFHSCMYITEESQQEYYDFVKTTYQRLFKEPESFFAKIYEDDAHPNRYNNSSYGKPELKRHMKADQTKIVELFELLQVIGRKGILVEDGIKYPEEASQSDQNKLSKKQLKLLTYLGFNYENEIIKHNVYTKIGTAIKHLSNKENALYSLMFCWFEEEYPYLERTFAKHYNPKNYERLVGWLNEYDYQWSNGSQNGILLDYYKSILPEETNLGYAIHGDKYHYGFTFEYRLEPRVMQSCVPRILQFANLLKNDDKLSAPARELILQRTKHCDFCRYCIQTDKSGKRPLAAIELDGVMLCPYYPGFSFTFEHLSDMDVDMIIALLSDMEKLLLI